VHYYEPEGEESVKTIIEISIDGQKTEELICYLNPEDYWEVGRIYLNTGQFNASDSCKINHNVKLELKD
jgi:hypothetical protein